MKHHPWPLLILFLVCVPITFTYIKAANPEEPDIKLLPVTRDMEESVKKAMAGCKPRSKEPQGSINHNGVYVLMGDLLKNGTYYAVIDNKENAIIAAWQKSNWKAIGALNLEPVWKYPDWDESTAGTRTPLATKPFWMVTLQNHPLLVVAAWVEKAGQNYFVVLFDARCERVVAFDNSFSLAPLVKDGYLIEADASRVKATSHLTCFSQIRDNKFEVKASWDEYTPYNNPEDPKAPYRQVFANGRTFSFHSDPDTSMPNDGFVFYKCIKQEDNAPPTKDEYLGRLLFTLKSGKPLEFYNEAEPEEMAYIFEKVTGLPRKLYQYVETNDYFIKELKPIHGSIESDAKITVEGSPEAIKLLSPTRIRWH